MRRLFYFTGHRLTVSHWDGRALVDRFSFEPDSEGLYKFEEYLKNSAKMRSKFLVDMIEEDFRVETTPHVYGKDKLAVVDRLLDRYYRSSGQFTYSEVLWRTKEGRRDDKVLIGAITNISLITPWIEIIDRCEIPLAGIWSAPLVSKDLLPMLKVGTDNVLLVSQQVQSNLRQSFFRNGKLLSSRTSVINTDNDGSIGAHAEQEIGRTLSYIRAQGYVDPEDSLEVHVVMSSEQVENMQSKMKPGLNQTLHFHSVSSLLENKKLTGVDDTYTMDLFAWLCSRKLSLDSNYGERSFFRNYYYSLASGALYATSVLVLLSSLLISLGNVTDGLELQKSIDLQRIQEAKFKETYSKRFEMFESVLNDAAVMKASVDLTNHIRAGASVSPLDFMIEMSRSLDSPKLGVIEIDKIQWEAKQLIKDERTNNEEYKKTNLAYDYPIYHVGVIEGRIAVSADNYRASVRNIEAIIEAIGKNERVVRVEALEMPVEVRSERAFTAESGASDASRRPDDAYGSFSIRVTLRGALDA